MCFIFLIFILMVIRNCLSMLAIELKTPFLD